MPKGEVKSAIAKAYLRQEFTNIFSGGVFDHDRHDAQMKNQIDNDKQEVVFGIFDNGAMAINPPTKEAKEGLGVILNDMTKLILQKGHTPSKTFTFALSDNIKKVNTSNENPETRNYVLTVQRGLLALNDFMKEVNAVDTLELFVEALTKSDTAIKSSLSPIIQKVPLNDTALKVCAKGRRQ